MKSHKTPNKNIKRNFYLIILTVILLADFLHLFYEEKHKTGENKNNKNSKKVQKLVVPQFPDSKKRKLVVPKFK